MSTGNLDACGATGAARKYGGDYHVMHEHTLIVTADNKTTKRR